MKTLRILGVATALATAAPTVGHALEITRAEVKNGSVFVKGREALSEAPLTWEGAPVGTAKANGRFDFETTTLPTDCVGAVSDGNETADAVIKFCGPVDTVGADFAARFGSSDTTSPPATSECFEGGGYVGQVFLFAGSFAPAGTLFADGRILPVASFSALFSVIGTRYGGDGRSTFGIPDLQDLAPDGVNYVICLGGTLPPRNPSP